MLFGRVPTRSPRAHSAARQGDLASHYDGTVPDLVTLFSAIAGSSDYLARLLTQERNWLLSAIDADAERVFDEIVGELPQVGDTEMAKALRIAKRRVALMTAVGDLGGVFSLSEVTGFLTRFAQCAVDLALRTALLKQVERKKLPKMTADNVSKNACGVVVLAMGKMGAFELNYSSDIDLIVLFDETQHDPDDYAELRAGFVKATRAMHAMLSDVTEHGYVFRTDLRLRPDPSVTPVCIAMEPAERYYERLGRTWERAAFIKARACAGDIAAGESFLQRLSPFIWRKHLDFAALQDAHDMVLRIREHKGLHGPLEFAGLDVKLGPGGIREIEFFAQTQQLIFGGRKLELRLRGTVETLTALAESDLVPDADVKVLIAAYHAHRDLEHRLQMMDDAQTHHIPQSEDGIAQAAALCGFERVEGFERDVLERCAQVHRVTVGEVESAPEQVQPSAFSKAAQELIERWQYLPALSSPRAQEIFEDLRPEVLAKLAQAANPDEALYQFDAFLSGLPAGVQLFSLFKVNGQLLDLLADICAKAPRLAQYLGRNSGVFDAVLSSDFFAPLEGETALEEELSDWLSRARDYEDVLDTARKWRKEQSFRTGVHLLRGHASPAEAAASYSAIAEACMQSLLPHVAGEVERRYGPVPGKGAAIIAMGKLGSREMTVTSDLDLIVVYDAEGKTFSDGPKELAVSTYFAKFTQALILALTTQTAQGALYEVDMRLRPSGNKGPVAVSLEGFASYQKNDAWTWELLALTRARLVGGQVDLCADVQGAISEALVKTRARSVVLADVADMRRRLAEAKGDGEIWDVKSGPGGLLDLELLVQTGLLCEQILDVLNPIEALSRLEASGFLSAGEVDILRKAFALRQSLQQVLRLVSEGRFEPEQADIGVQNMVLDRAGFGDFASLEAELRASAKMCAALFETKLTP